MKSNIRCGGVEKEDSCSYLKSGNSFACYDTSKSDNIMGNIASIETTGFVDGPGVRVIVFMQGCPLRCLYCHNPEDAFFDTTRYLMTPEEVVAKIVRYKNYFGKNGGVTFSGGEPLNQPEFLLEVLKLCKQNKINTAIDTSGCAKNIFSRKKEDLLNEILKYVDLVILDIKATDSQEYKKITGQDIKYFEKFLTICQKAKKKLWLRQVIVPGINDNIQNINNLKKYISKIKYVKKVELLPYHDMAKEKYKKLGLTYRLSDTPNMSAKKCAELQKILD